MTDTTIEGTILTGTDLEPIEGRLVVDDGTITAIEETTTDSASIVCPAFVNAHTHIADSIVKEAGGGLSLEALVAPPDGLKHRRLRAADRADLVAAMRRSARFMRRSGTAAFVDFREGGPEGVSALREAVADLAIDATVCGRGDPAVLETADAYGASGAADDDFTTERAAASEAEKPFMIHAGEAGAHDIDPALALDPDVLVHMVHASEAHLDELAARDIPVVVCPRSNLVTDAGLPPVADLAAHTTVALGTDNVMLNSPAMFREMEFTAKLTDCTAREILQMATVNGARIAGRDERGLQEGAPADVLVIDGDTDNLAGYEDPHRAVVRRAGVDDVERVC
jgi:cytosine/adenosine deaminase-related metal-dependent hydrolase